MTEILITGSLAYDTIMMFHDRFERHILSEALHKINVAFMVPDMRRQWGGCAGNIAYNLALLGEKPRIMATVGEDFSDYHQRLKKLGLATDAIEVIPDSYTAQAFIITDQGNNQITAFHPGAMQRAYHQQHVQGMAQWALAIVSPNGKQGMVEHVEQLHRQAVPCLLDLGQSIPLFEGDEIRYLFALCSHAAMNDYEAELIEEKTGASIEHLAAHMQAVVITLGEQGSRYYHDERWHEVAAMAVDSVLDPTGCGDAYRAGLLYGLVRAWDMHKTCVLASVLGGIKISARGGQGHHFDWADIARYAEHHYQVKF